MCWGDYSVTPGNTTTGTLVPVPVQDLSSGVAAISATDDSTCALTTAGAVMCWGPWGWGPFGNNLVPVAVEGLPSGVIAISARKAHTCALTSSGAVWCWGENAYGELGNNSTTGTLVPVAVEGLASGVSAISAGDNHTCALTSGGAVLCWGANFNGQLGNNSTAQSLIPVEVTGL
jgi:alpha-tubulin suppressor-like RCC1 family protein